MNKKKKNFINFRKRKKIVARYGHELPRSAVGLHRGIRTRGVSMSAAIWPFINERMCSHLKLLKIKSYRLWIERSRVGGRGHLFSLFVSFFIKRGKGVITREIIQELNRLSIKLNVPRISVLALIFLRLTTVVEVRHLRYRKKLSVVPFLIKSRRQRHIILHWLFLAIQAGGAKRGYMSKLFLEIESLLTQKTAISIGYKIKNNQLAYKHRSNAHFRW
jgi:ribosomal protein S7